MNRILAFGPKNLLSMQASIHEPAAIFRAADYGFSIPSGNWKEEKIR
jgi:hypothetical protein